MPTTSKTLMKKGCRSSIEMLTYIFTTGLKQADGSLATNASVCIVAVGKDEQAAIANAEQAVSSLQGTALTGHKLLVNHSIIVNLAISVLSKAKSDDVLIRQLTEKFGKRALIEVKNDLLEDGAVRKHFYVDGKDVIHLDLKNKTQVESYEETGLNEGHMNVITERLEYIIAQNEMTISTPDGENGDEPVLQTPPDEIPAE